jgi:tetratricopeptide (TPR) repeat protein/TolB-like protein
LVATITGVVTYQRATAPKEVVRLAMLPFTYSSDLAPVAEGVFHNASANLAKIRGGSKVRYSAVSLDEVQRAKVQTPEQAKAVFGATHILHGTLTKEGDRVVLRALLTDTRTGVNTREWKMDYIPGQERYLPVALAGFATGALHLPVLATPAMNAAAERDYQAGSILLRRDSTVDAAVSAFERAHAADPDSALVYAGLAEAQWLKYGLTRGSDWLTRATESTKQAQRRNPDIPRVLYVSGTLDFVNSLYELAAAEYQRALELEPGYSDVHRFLGRVYALIGQPAMALAAYRSAIQNDPGNYRGYVFLGWFYNDMDQFSQAVTPLRQAVALAPDEPDARDQLGFAYKSLGQFPAAEAELRTALQFGETVFVLDQMGETLMYQRREQEAIPFFKRALAIDPNEFIALMELGTCYRRLNRRPEWVEANRDGLRAAEAAKRLNPRNGNTRSILAYFHSQLGQPQEAESEISQALTFSPDGVGVRWAAALTYEALGKRDATLSLLTSASPELSADLNRWPDLAGLQSDPRFIQLLISNHVQ